jgi:hypothetical protein
VLRQPPGSALTVDLYHNPHAEWQEWLDDPDGKCDREAEACMREFRTGQAP